MDTSIRKAMNAVASHKYLIPEFQRDFVWDTVRVENLFDSLMRDYPISTFMLWKISEKEIKNNFSFYQFVSDYFDKDFNDNPKVPTAALTDEFYAVIDGQQRLTSLYVGLYGTYRTLKPKKQKATSDNLYVKRLYLNLMKPAEGSSNETEKYYDFRFLTDVELEKAKLENPSHWFLVSKIIELDDLPKINSYLKSNDLGENVFASNTLTKLQECINDEGRIKCFDIEDQKIDRVLNIFVRANDGGVKLSFSDLLLSIASAKWTEIDAREEFKLLRRDIKNYGTPSFNVTKDLIMKAMLVLNDEDVQFKLSNFNAFKIKKYENNWKNFRLALLNTFRFLYLMGFNDSSLKAKNAVIPIAYYIQKKNLTNLIIKRNDELNENDLKAIASLYSVDKKHALQAFEQVKKTISKWLNLSLLKGIFGGTSDNVLKDIRDVLKNTKSNLFPFDEICEKFKEDSAKNYKFDDDVINGFLDAEYQSSAASQILLLLYPETAYLYGNLIAQDHMHPKANFKIKKLRELGYDEEKIRFYCDKANYNSILNLQLLSSSINSSKSDSPLKEWASVARKKEKDLYVEPGTSLEFNDFKQFIESRRKCLFNALKNILGKF